MMYTNTYLNELKRVLFDGSELGCRFKPEGACIVEIPTRGVGVYTMYGIKDSLLRIFSAKRVKNYKEALTIVKKQYEIGYIDTDTAVATTAMIYLNEMAKRCEVKTPVVIDLLTGSNFSIIDIDGVITNLDNSIYKLHTNEIAVG